MREQRMPLSVSVRPPPTRRRKHSNGSARWVGPVARPLGELAPGGWRSLWEVLKSCILQNLSRSGILTVYCLKKCATKAHKKLKIAFLVNLLSFLWYIICTVGFFFYNFIIGNSMSTVQRKRRGGRSTRQTHKQNRLVGSSSGMATEGETIELTESAGEEVVDLTCESSDPVVVDLTHNDSVVIVEDNHRQRRNISSRLQLESSVLSSDEEDLRENVVYVTNTTSRPLVAVEAGAIGSLLYRVDVLLCLQSVAMSSVASAFVMPLKMLVHAQLVERN
uniref:E3 ubiquitin-protein ligase RNF4 isoform X2 n=1 Tax=Geotrypetes seraphini TaxID=260995 RepID=A0A6P8RMP1_GEOSA|nr:E3 ubiquitin-protein ligase RNF4 isoform X2 [Geotrypetes seraphini]